MVLGNTLSGLRVSRKGLSRLGFFGGWLVRGGIYHSFCLTLGYRDRV